MLKYHRLEKLDGVVSSHAAIQVSGCSGLDRRLAVTPTNRNSVQIADITNQNQISCILVFSDIVNIYKL
jgi:hypothetical protein